MVYLYCGECGKLIGLLLLFCLPLLSTLFFKTPTIRGITCNGNHFSSVMYEQIMIIALCTSKLNKVKVFLDTYMFLTIIICMCV